MPPGTSVLEVISLVAEQLSGRSFWRINFNLLLGWAISIFPVSLPWNTWYLYSNRILFMMGDDDAETMESSIVTNQASFSYWTNFDIIDFITLLFWIGGIGLLVAGAVS